MSEATRAVAVRIEATAIGGGIAIARARVLQAGSADWPRFHIEKDAVGPQIERLKAAMGAVSQELQKLADQLPQEAPPEAHALLSVHGLMLEDATLREASYSRIENELVNAEWALGAQGAELAEQFESLEDEYLRERARDVRQVVARVMRCLVQDQALPAIKLPQDEAFIVVAEDLAPADMLHLKAALGFVVGLGGVNSHTAILARSLDKPAVVGVGESVHDLRDDDWLIVDGDAGVVIVNPDAALLARYRGEQQEQQQKRKALRSLIGLASRTKDGVGIELLCNIEGPSETALAMDVGAAGIGLFRSEFLFLNRDVLPSEDEQYEAYRTAVLGMQGRPITIRTLDVGADKALPGQHRHQSTGEQVVNTALGQRAIRYCLANPVLFMAQLRAILRASAHGPVKLLLPMVAHPHEVGNSLEFIALAKEQLRHEGQPFNPALQVGAMIEIPAAAIAADWFARELDFLSIGTNDLVQYTLAIDRDDPSVAALYDPWHPAVLRLIEQTLAAGRRQSTPITLCGEMAGQIEFTEVLIGLGLTSFSMHASSLLKVKERLLSLDSRKAASAASAALGKMLP